MGAAVAVGLLVVGRPVGSNVGQCHAVQAQFAVAEVQSHGGGHTVPNDAAAVARFGAFLDARLAELRPELVSEP